MLLKKIIRALDNSSLSDAEKWIYYAIAKDSAVDLQRIILEALETKDSSEYARLRNRLADYLVDRTNQAQKLVDKSINKTYKMTEHHLRIDDKVAWNMLIKSLQK